MGVILHAPGAEMWAIFPCVTLARPVDSVPGNALHIIGVNTNPCVAFSKSLNHCHSYTLGTCPELYQYARLPRKCFHHRLMRCQINVECVTLFFTSFAQIWCVTLFLTSFAQIWCVCIHASRVSIFRCSLTRVFFYISGHVLIFCKGSLHLCV